ncbi:MAG: rhodanese-like domain-containing protein [Hyphomonas sp.]|uniref:rhodanese-like domain-containing protein n=1 Tax=Hyphomonas sp. TaxID=87 RepID=UPI0035285BC9
MKRLTTLALASTAFLALPALADPQQIAADAAWNMVQRGDLVLIDVRTPSEWAMTGLPRDAHPATLQDVDFLAQARGAVLGDLAQPVAVICRSGNRSSAAAALLEKAGFSHVFEVNEGMSGNDVAGAGWIKRGLPVDPFIPPDN